MAATDITSSSTPTFGLALRGYDRAAVDGYLADARRQLIALTEEVARLRAERAGVEDSRVVLGDQAGEILWSADVRAAEILDLAHGGAVPLPDLYERARAECEQLLTAAQFEAERTLETARQQAATIDERARQEYAWRRRQVRQEQDLVDRRKQQIVHQIVTLSELATQTASSPATAEPAEHQVVEQRVAV